MKRLFRSDITLSLSLFLSPARSSTLAGLFLFDRASSIIHTIKLFLKIKYDGHLDLIVRGNYVLWLVMLIYFGRLILRGFVFDNFCYLFSRCFAFLTTLSNSIATRYRILIRLKFSLQFHFFSLIVFVTI